MSVLSYVLFVLALWLYGMFCYWMGCKDGYCEGCEKTENTISRVLADRSDDHGP